MNIRHGAHRGLITLILSIVTLTAFGAFTPGAFIAVSYFVGSITKGHAIRNGFGYPAAFNVIHWRTQDRVNLLFPIAILLAAITDDYN